MNRAADHPAPAMSPALAAPTAAPAAASGRPLSMQIDRVVLQGVPLAPADGARVERALSQALHRLITDGNVDLQQLQPQAIDRLQLPELRLEAGVTPEQLGHRLAAALWGGLKP
ncbi:hypothetical protein AACH06_23655 [Ideonella sp. DXS29W]|uniref:Uncharacterized protein n=1 Tax=Ideonella lacteola TaxID=2984193 RepID=A0ABU9BVF6_9BURK